MPCLLQRRGLALATRHIWMLLVPTLVVSGRKNNQVCSTAIGPWSAPWFWMVVHVPALRPWQPTTITALVVEGKHPMYVQALGATSALGEVV